MSLLPPQGAVIPPEAPEETGEHEALQELENAAREEAENNAGPSGEPGESAGGGEQRRRPGRPVGAKTGTGTRKRAGAGSAGGGGKLSSPANAGGGGGDGAGSGAKADGKAGGAATSRPVGRKRGAVRDRQQLREQLAAGLTLTTQLGFQGLGYYRSQKFKAEHPQLAKAIFECYVIPDEAAKSIGEPVAETIAEYLPDTWLETAANAASPLQGAFCLFLVVQQVMENEKRVVEQYIAAIQNRNLGNAQADPLQANPADLIHQNGAMNGEG